MMNSQDFSNLEKRYLIWLYKDCKDKLDRYERKFSQLEIDKNIYKRIESELSIKSDGSHNVKNFLREYEEYIDKKKNECDELKHKDLILNDEFSFLNVKIASIEQTIIDELGIEELEKIKQLYEDEMIQRIMKRDGH